MTSYSNSRSDRATGVAARATDEEAVRALYEAAPYPDLGADLKTLEPYLRPVESNLAQMKGVRLLDAGCGTGHLLVGIARDHPDWACHGIDLSDAALAVARALAARHEAKIDVRRASYLDPLPFDGGPFDIIVAMGTIHHAADPVGAMRALRESLADDGWFLLHLYGWRCDAGKFDLKAALDLLQPDLDDHAGRFALYDSLLRHRERRWLHRLATTSAADIYSGLRTRLRNLRRRQRHESWSPPWTDRFAGPTSPWVDHFCHPCERAYEVPAVRALVEAGGFRLVHNLRQGIDHPQLVPPEWRDAIDALDPWQRMRMFEVLADGGGSFAMWLKKA